MKKSVLIPANINVENLLNGLNGRKDYIENIKEGMIYFISLITVDNHYFYELKDGYRNLNGEYLDNVIGKGKRNIRRSNTIIDILENNGVIEKNKYKIGVKSTGYRLTEKFCTGVFKSYELSDDILFRFNKYSKYKLSQEEVAGYNLLEEEFIANNLDIDILNLHSFIKKIGTHLIQRINNEKCSKAKTYKSFFNYFGRTLNLVKDFKDKNYQLKISDNNGRFYSNLTSFPKIFRPFLMINNIGIGEVDITSSQPYILSTVLTEDFYNNVNYGYNLKTIYPHLKEKIEKLGGLNLSKQKGNDKMLLGIYLKSKAYEKIISFNNFDFTKDYYSYILSEGEKLYPNYIKNNPQFKKGREFLKKQTMNYLFESNDNKRDNNVFGILMKLLYPDMVEFIKSFNYNYSATEFSHLLQKTESFLILNVCRRIKEYNPKIPIFTIHDSIITTEDNLKTVEKILKDEVKKLTGKEVGVKNKKLEKPMSPKIKDLDKILGKIKITSTNKWNSRRTYITDKNMNKGIEFFCNINKEFDNLYVKLKLNNNK